MRTLFRLTFLLFLVAAGIGLAAAVVNFSDPASHPSPAQMPPALRDAASGRSPAAALTVLAPEAAASPSDVMPEAAAAPMADAAEAASAAAPGATPSADSERPAPNTPGEAESHSPTGPQPTPSNALRLANVRVVAPTAVAVRPATPTTKVLSEATPQTEMTSAPAAPPAAVAPPAVATSNIYITTPAITASTSLIPGAVEPHQVAYAPRVASQIRAPAAQGSLPDGPALGDPRETEALPAPPKSEKPSPTAAPAPAIQRGEGDDALIVNIQNSDIREVLSLLSEQGDLNILASKNVTGKVSASLKDVDVRAALKAILKSTGFVARYDGNFVYVGTPQDLKEMDRSSDVLSTRIYRPNYVSAQELQTLVEPMLTESVGKATVSTAASVDIPTDNVKTGGNGFAGGDVLLVHDYEAVLVQVDQVVDSIDQRPAQVSIEAVILTVNLNDAHRLGVNFELLRDQDNIRIISGNPISDLAALDLMDGGLKVGFLDSSLSVLVQALETVGNTNVVASPRLMCLNKQRAEIHIGQQLGYVSTTVTETAATQTVQFLEVGTQLRLRPFVSSDGTIRMEIHPELSTGQVDVLGGITLPNKVVTQVTSNVMCRDGCTLVIGGLIREDLDSQSTQIPLLGSLPLVGAVFRQKTESIKRDEIIVVITPRIVREPLAAGEGRRALAAGREHMETFADKMSPIGTRYYGRRYLRMARSAWEAGDACTALRYVNLAIHFDRQSSEALQLRQEIASVLPATDIDVDRRLRQGLAPWSHPRVEYSRQGYPWRPPQRLAVAGDGSPVETAEGFYVELSDDELPGLGRPEAVVETPPALPSPPTKTTIPGRPSVP